MSHAPEHLITAFSDLFDEADHALLAFANLLGSSWKLTATRPAPRIELGVSRQGDGSACYVKDNGAGFDMAFANKLFGVFQRRHAGHELEGNGIATVQRIILRHGGRIWADAAVEHGATFYVTVGAKDARA